MLDILDKLIDATQSTPKRIAVVGDSMVDEYIYGDMVECQDGCYKFVENHTQGCRLPGGAANAARQLTNWRTQTILYGLTGSPGQPNCVPKLGNYGTSVLPAGFVPIKRRFMKDGRCVFRHDDEPRQDSGGIARAREYCLECLSVDKPDVVLISDYDKGLIEADFCDDIAMSARLSIADAKRSIARYRHCNIIKGNKEWACNNHPLPPDRTFVMTDGPDPPTIFNSSGQDKSTYRFMPVDCKNHIGSGDCFSAHLALALAHGFQLEDAVTIAHSAGRCYVQHIHNRPPHPLEIRKDLDTILGKIIPRKYTAMLAAILKEKGGAVFTNGVFRLPHAGHAWLLDWARKKGNALVVGVNSDESAAKLRPGEYILPFAERARILASMSAVDWVVPFDEPDPVALIKELTPQYMTKGGEYYPSKVPGYGLAEYLKPPQSPYPDHASQIVDKVRSAPVEFYDKGRGVCSECGGYKYHFDGCPKR